MENLISHILIGITTFVVTNIDDLLILSIYFANPHYKKSHIVIGQYIGVLTLAGISLFGLLLGKVVAPEWIGLLGLIPLFLGIKGLIELIKGEEDEATQTRKSKFSIQFLNVALITIANGGDNLGVYTPLFASISPRMATFYIFIFIIMIAVWCAFAYYLVKHPSVKMLFVKFGHIILPLFLILLGIWILIESESYNLILGSD